MGREEAAPSFLTWKNRLEQTSSPEIKAEVARFLQVLRAVGSPMIDGDEVHFVYYGPEAHQVLLAGEFNQWSRRGLPIELKAIGETGVFFHTLKINEPGRLEYKFIVDGEWRTDPFCAITIDNGVGGENSAFVIGDFEEPPELQARANIAHGRVEQFEFHSDRLSNTRQVHVYLPAEYDEDNDKRFPAFYVHDGGEYLDRAKITTVIDNLVAEGKIPPLIAVMIDPVNRMVEYMANQKYADFLAIDFIPAIDARYRALADRRSRGVMGASLGGLISIYTALTHPTVFSRVAGQSSALQFEESKTTSLATGVKRASFRFYLDVGSYEPSFIPAHIRFTGILRKRRWPFQYQEVPAGHNWTSWRAHLKDLLVFLWSDDSPATRPAKRRTK